jgi:hypothetical protein
MRSSEPSRPVKHTLPRPRVWQDAAAESLLGVAVAVIALTGVDSLVLQTNLWLAGVIPQYDPVVTMLVLVCCLVASLVIGSIGLKASARRAAEEPRVPEHTGPRPARLRRSLPYLGSIPPAE